MNGIQDVFIIYDEDTNSYKVLGIKEETGMMSSFIPIESKIDDVSAAVMIKNAFTFGQSEGYKEARKKYKPKIVRVVDEEYGDDYISVCSSCKNELSDKFKYCPYCGGHIENN